ncbi:MAG TPA: glycosyltransferase [Thermotogota bacterium]|nr:glycosyltransferase [Thermotogota bacterium]
MKILFVIGLAPLANFRTKGYAVINRIKEYKKLGIECEIVCPVNYFSSDILGRITEKRASYPRTRTRILGDIEIQYPRYYSIPRKSGIFRIVEPSIEITKPDLIITHWGPTGWGSLPAAKRAGILFIQYFHGSDIHTIPKKNKYCLRETRRLLTESNLCFFVSNDLQNKAEGLIGRKIRNGYVIPNGIDPAIFKLLDLSAVCEFRRSLGISSNKKIIGFVGNLIPIKGLLDFPGIIRELKMNFRKSDLFFIFVGDGPLKPYLEKSLRSTKFEFIFTGEVKPETVAQYLNLFDVMILPSLKEGWPCVVLESFACGTPVISSNNGGGSEIIEQLPMCGKIVNRDNDFAYRFASEIDKILSVKKERECLSQKSRVFSWKELVKREISIINSSCANK